VSTVDAAIYAAIAAAVPNQDVYAEAAPDEPDPAVSYVVVYAGRSRDATGAYNGDTRDGEYRWQATCVGPDADTVKFLSDAIFEYLKTHRLTAAGYLLRRPRLEYGQLPYPDDTVPGRAVVTKADIYTMEVHRVT
jgi:hypothetical protein